MCFITPVLPVGVKPASPPDGNAPETPVAPVVVRVGAPPPGGPSGGVSILLKLLRVVDDAFVPGMKFGGEVRNVGPNPAGSSGEAFAVSIHKVKANPVLRGVKVHPVSSFGAAILVFGFEDGGFRALAAGLGCVVGGALRLVPV